MSGSSNNDGGRGGNRPPPVQAPQGRPPQNRPADNRSAHNRPTDARPQPGYGYQDRVPPNLDAVDPAFDLEPIEPTQRLGRAAPQPDGDRRYDAAHDPRYAQRPGLPPPQAGSRPQLGADPRLSLNPDRRDGPVAQRIPSLSNPHAYAPLPRDPRDAYGAEYGAEYGPEPTRPVAPQGYPQSAYAQAQPTGLPRAPFETGRYAPIDPGRGPQDLAEPIEPIAFGPESLADDRAYAEPEIGVPRTARPQPIQNDTFSAPATAQRTQRQLAAATPIVPPGTVAGKSLTLVVAIMCCLASLTAGAVYLIHQSARGWMQEIASEVTVQIEPKDRVDIEKQLRDTAQFLMRQPGVKAARVLSFEESAAPLEAWLGSSDALKSLPVPRLISLELDRDQIPSLQKLEADLQGVARGARIDDHRLWLRQIRTMTNSFVVGGFIILALMGAATMAVIISAARGALLANKEIVEVLHFVGATDKFIAREFQAHFLRVGIKAGVFGVGLAGLFFLGLPFLLDLLGSGTVRMSEWRRIIGTGALDMYGYLVLLGVVVFIAGICWMTSRLGVYRILRAKPDQRAEA